MIPNDEIGILKDVRRIGNTSDRFVSVSVQSQSSLITFIHNFKLYIKDLNFYACLVKGSIVNLAAEPLPFWSFFFLGEPCPVRQRRKKEQKGYGSAAIVNHTPNTTEKSVQSHLIQGVLIFQNNDYILTLLKWHYDV